MVATYPKRGPVAGELTIDDLWPMWGLSRTRTWQLVVKENVVPFRRDVAGRIFIKRVDAEGYQHEQRRGRPPGENYNG